MIDSTDAMGAVVGMAAVTVLLRAAPFIGARWLKRWSLVEELGRFLPPAIMSLLLLHTIAGTAKSHSGGLGMELSAVILTIALQLRWRQPLLSIASGTLLYIALRGAVHVA